MTVRTSFALLLIAIVFTSPTLAVVKVDMPVSKMFASAKAVAVGTVTAVKAENRVVEVKITETLKGDIGGESVRIQIVQPEDLIKAVAKDRPVVVMVSEAKGKSTALIHLAETWLLAEQVPNLTPPVWRVTAELPAHRKAFPGATESLTKVLSEIKADKSTLLDITDARVADDIRKGPKLDAAKATALLTADVNGDGKSDLIVGTPGGIKLFLATDKGYDDATAAWGLADAKGAPLAVGDLNGDGKCDLLIGDTIYLNDGGKFAAKGKIDAGGVKAIAAAIADIDADGKNDILLLTAEGQLVVFKNPGDASKPWAKETRTLWKDDPAAAACFGTFGDGSLPHVLVVRESGVTRYALDPTQPPADFRRLTGVDLRTYYKRYADGLKNPRVVALDINGDGRRDALAICRTGGMLMVNRGFGVFLDVYDAGDAAPDTVKPPAQPQTLAERFKAVAGADLLAPTTLMAPILSRAGKSDDLIALTEDGQVYVLVNFAGKRN